MIKHYKHRLTKSCMDLLSFHQDCMVVGGSCCHLGQLVDMVGILGMGSHSLGPCRQYIPELALFLLSMQAYFCIEIKTVKGYI